MKLSDLEIFVQVAEAGGMTQAAALRGSSQPAISRTLRDLESRLRAPLLKRTGRGVELTPAGARFLDFARDTLADFDETQRAVRSLAGAMPAKLDIAVPLRVGRLAIPALHKRFAAALPEIGLHVYEDSSARMASALRNHDYDMALVYADGSAAVPGQERLFSEALYAVGPRAELGDSDRDGDHPLPLSELAPLPLLLPGSGSPFRRLIETRFRRQGLEPTIARELETSEAALAFAMEGEGVAILPYSNVYRECQIGEVSARPIVAPGIERDICLAISAQTDRRLAQIAARVLREALAGIAGQARWRRARG